MMLIAILVIGTCSALYSIIRGLSRGNKSTSGCTASSRDSFRNWSEFVQSPLSKHLIKVEVLWAFAPGILQAQAYLENRGGLVLGYNWANVKATPSWPEGCSKGQDAYRRYRDYDEATRDYLRIVQRYYSYAWDNHGDAWGYFVGLTAKTYGVGLNDWAGPDYNELCYGVWREHFA